MMKRYWLPIVLVVTMIVAQFSYRLITKGTKENRQEVFQVEEVKLMDMKKSELDFSPIMSAMFYSNIVDGNFPMSFDFSYLSSTPINSSVPMYAGVECGKFRLTCPLQLPEPEVKDNLYVYRFSFHFNLCDLISNNKLDEMAVLDYAKTLLAVFPKENVFVGDASELELFLKGNWKNASFTVNSLHDALPIY